MEVFESFASFKPLGSGINLANNAMQVYRQLGLYDRILAQSNPVVGIAVSLRNHLMRLPPSSVGQKQSAYLFKVPGLS